MKASGKPLLRRPMLNKAKNNFQIKLTIQPRERKESGQLDLFLLAPQLAQS
jgi:hypothetical protein